MNDTHSSQSLANSLKVYDKYIEIFSNFSVFVVLFFKLIFINERSHLISCISRNNISIDKSCE